MRSRELRGRFVATLAVVAALLGSAALAEVSVTLGPSGELLDVVYLDRDEQGYPVVWRRVRSDVPASWILNRPGDVNGDLVPAIGFNGAWGTPVVVWSHFDGTDYEVVWSFWAGTRWRAAQAVELEDNMLDDLDPDVDFDAQGHVYVTWWRVNTEGRGEVYLSLFGGESWSAPVLISQPEEHAHEPRVSAHSAGRVYIAYKTEYGNTGVMLNLEDGTGINDDIDILPRDEHVGASKYDILGGEQLEPNPY